jgi:hypothetical protein
MSSSSTGTAVVVRPDGGRPVGWTPGTTVRVVAGADTTGGAFCVVVVTE